MNKRDLTLDKYGISKKRYRELKYFCEQYPEWKNAVANQTYLSAVTYDGMPHSANIGDPTQAKAMNFSEKSAHIDLIDSVAVSAAGDMWVWLIRNICYEVPVDWLILSERMPMSKAQFYDYRRYFFFLLDQKRR